MEAEKILKQLREAKMEHNLRGKPGEVAIYDALIYIVEKLTVEKQV